MGTRKNNPLNFDSWLLRSWNSTGRCSGLFPPNCLHKQQLTFVKHSGPHVLSTTVPRTAEMGAQWDLSSLCVQVGFLLLSFLYPSPMQGLLHWVNSALAFLLSRTEQTIIYVYAWIHKILFFTPAGSAYEVSLLLGLDMKYVLSTRTEVFDLFYWYPTSY